MADPFPKSKQLARGERRYRRKVASPKQWAAIRAEKGETCRLKFSGCVGAIQMHHVVPRSQGGDDTADNIVPLCFYCHAAVTTRSPSALEILSKSLTDAEYAYVTTKLGENAMERLFGV